MAGSGDHESNETHTKHEQSQQGDNGGTIPGAQVEHTLETEKDITQDEEKSRPHAVTQEEYLGGGNIADHALHMSTARRTALFASLSMGLMLALMDNTVVATSLLQISLHFNSLAESIWVILAYTLTYLGFGVMFARASDHLGRIYAMPAAFGIFIVFSLAAEFAQTLPQLIAFRAIQGIGGSGMYALAFILVMEISPPKLLPLASAIVGFTVALAGIFGPLIGGLLTTYTTWRWIFWINGPIAVIPMVVFALAWPKKIQTFRPTSLGRFDWEGSVLLLGACILVVYAFQEASSTWAWSSANVLATMIVGWLCWVALFVWEWYAKDKNIASVMPWAIITDRIIVAAIINTSFTAFVSFLVIFSLPLRFQIVNGKSPAWAGVHLLPMLAATGVGSFAGAGLNSKKDRFVHALVAGSAFLMLASGLLTTLGDGTPIQGKVYGFLFILGLGVGLNLSTTTMLTGRTARVEHHAVLQGIISQMRVFGGALGVAVSNAIFTGEARARLGAELSVSQIQGLQTSTDILLSLSPEQDAAVRATYAYSFTTAMKLCIGISGVAMIASFFVFKRQTPKRLGSDS